MTVTPDHRLMQLLVCPVCKGSLRARSADNGGLAGLEGPADRLLFPVRDGIPLMLESEALPLDDADAQEPSSPSAA